MSTEFLIIYIIQIAFSCASGALQILECTITKNSYGTGLIPFVVWLFSFIPGVGFAFAVASIKDSINIIREYKGDQK